MNYTTEIDLMNCYSQLHFLDYTLESMDICNEEVDVKRKGNIIITGLKKLGGIVLNIINNLIKPFKKILESINLAHVRGKLRQHKTVKFKYTYRRVNIKNCNELESKQENMFNNMMHCYEVLISKYNAWIRIGRVSEKEMFEQLNPSNYGLEDYKVSEGDKNLIEAVSIDKIDDGYVLYLVKQINWYKQKYSILDDKCNKVYDIIDKLSKMSNNIISSSPYDKSSDVLDVINTMHRYITKLTDSYYLLTGSYNLSVNYIQDMVKKLGVNLKKEEKKI